MPICEAEQKDLDKLKTDQADIREMVFTMCREYLRMDEKQLAMCGQRKGADAACADTIKQGLRDIEKLTQAFLKKWPDQTQ